MQFEQPLPFYMAYPFLMPFDQEREQEKDLQLMQSYYSRRASRIQQKVERECDRMEYDGSMMFDEYPDKFMMEHLCRKIEREILSEDEKEDQQQSKTETRAMERDRGDGLRDLIGVLLFNEMFRRRCRHRRCRRFF
ncbi:MAG: hypothetical protein SPF19_01010 [Oliverpabstia sp.]|nr:hypothetical protein [Lachnospiraceae bacterium]MDY5025100.1 hypothetical protein [Oliverpabstia sp.]